MNFISRKSIQQVRDEIDSSGELSSEAIEVLSGVRVLSLNGLTQMTDQQAKVLIKQRMEIELNGLTQLTDYQAKLCSKVPLDGLIKIVDFQSKSFSIVTVALQLNGLECISEQQAENLSGFSGEERELKGLKSLTHSQLENMAKIGGLELSEYLSKQILNFKKDQTQGSRNKNMFSSVKQPGRALLPKMRSTRLADWKDTR